MHSPNNKNCFPFVPNLANIEAESKIGRKGFQLLYYPSLPTL